MDGSPNVGIEGIAVAIPRRFLALETLAVARGVDPAKYREGLGCYRMAVPGPEEDAVTLAAEAVRSLMRHYEVDPNRVGMLVVGTESGVDAAKPIAAFVHGLTGLGPRCRTFDTVHACYGATAALRLAADWCARDRGRRAIVVASDIARYDAGSAGEPTQGAGAVAMLVSSNPAILAFEPFPEATYTADVMDFWRPVYRSTALVDGKYSLECYLNALRATYESFERGSGLSMRDYDRLLFHIPFPKMAYKAFRLLYEREQALRPGLAPLDEEFEARTGSALWANREVGNLYSASLYLAIAALVERDGESLAGRRVGLFSYGSGSCAEFWSGRIGSDPAAWRGRIGVTQALQNRIEVTADEYMALRLASEEKAKNESYRGPDPSADGQVRFLGIEHDRRVYHRPDSGPGSVESPYFFSRLSS